MYLRSTPTQLHTRHNLNLTQLSWVGHDYDFAHQHTTTTQTKLQSKSASDQHIMLPEGSHKKLHIFGHCPKLPEPTSAILVGGKLVKKNSELRN